MTFKLNLMMSTRVGKNPGFYKKKPLQGDYFNPAGQSLPLSQPNKILITKIKIQRKLLSHITNSVHSFNTLGPRTQKEASLNQ